MIGEKDHISNKCIEDNGDEKRIYISIALSSSNVFLMLLRILLRFIFDFIRYDNDCCNCENMFFYFA